VFDGHWVPDATYPLYNSSECPFAEKGFNCLANGREDTGYLKWRWRPRRCDVPRFTAGAALERLRGKRVVFVGDSMSRTQWESFICMLMPGVDDPKTVYLRGERERDQQDHTVPRGEVRVLRPHRGILPVRVPCRAAPCVQACAQEG
jgi:hypothetical protein